MTMPALELAAHFVKQIGRGALERENRLLFVADRKQRARPQARAGPGEEVRRQSAQNIPLRPRRVLRLVDQDVIDAGIELVEHPGGIGFGEKSLDARDQIIEIEPAARVLEPGIVAAHSLHNLEQRAAARDRLRRTQSFAQRCQARALGFEFLDDFRMRLGDRFGRHRFARRSHSVGGEKHLQKEFERKIGIRQYRRAGEHGRQRLVGRPARLQSPRPGAPAPRAIPHPRLERRLVFAFAQTESGGQCGGVGLGVAVRGEVLAPPQRGRQQLIERISADGPGDPLDRRGERFRALGILEQARPRRLHQPRRLALFDDLEPRGRVRLEGKKMQQPFAKGVDRLNF